MRPLVLPALDLIGGRAVRLVQGRRDRCTDMGDPLTLARRFAEAGATRLHVVDLEGAFDGAPRHLALVERLAAILPVQLGGGLRTADDLRAAVSAGADRIVLGTAAIESPELVDTVPRERCVLGVDVKDDRVAVRGWESVAPVSPEDFVAGWVARGVVRFLCTAVARDGMMGGPDLALLRRVALPGARIIASGGVAAAADLDALGTIAGVDEVVVGKALLTGAIALEEAFPC